MQTILGDVASGAYSVLERRYLTDVERPHGLPTGMRQRRVSMGRTVAYRDVEYLGLRTLVELDGGLGHESPRDRWADLDRDVDAAVAGDLTLRVGWGAGAGRLPADRGGGGHPARPGLGRNAAELRAGVSRGRRFCRRFSASRVKNCGNR
jgi:hypothetical protein